MNDSGEALGGLTGVELQQAAPSIGVYSGRYQSLQQEKCDAENPDEREDGGHLPASEVRPVPERVYNGHGCTTARYLSKVRATMP